MGTVQFSLTVPPGFVRAGGKRLPLKHREAACREISDATKGTSDRVQVEITTQRIVRKYERISREDRTDLYYGPTTVPVYEDPDAAGKARRMLIFIASAPEFDGCLTKEEFQVWTWSFTEQVDQTVIAERLDKTQGAVSKIVRRAAQKLNSRYLELHAADRLPLQIAAWITEMAPAIVSEPDLMDALRLIQAVDFLRRRDRARGKLGEKVYSGCAELDRLRIRHSRK